MSRIWEVSLILVVIWCCISNSNATNITVDDGLQLLYQKRQVEALSVREKIQALISGWRQLSNEKRQELLHSFNTAVDSLKDVEDSQMMDPNSLVIQDLDLDGIEIYSYRSYMSYWPIIRWNLARRPADNSYWVGLYRVGAGNRDHLVRHPIRRRIRGSYRVGRLRRVALFQRSRTRDDMFELRLFRNGFTRVDAVSSVLHGSVANPMIVDMEGEENARSSIPDHEIELNLQNFISTLESVSSFTEEEESTLTRHLYSQEELATLWSEFDTQEQQLLLPVLEQECLPDYIKKPDLHYDDRYEPNFHYRRLKEDEVSSSQYANTTQGGINKLTITLQRSTASVYPAVHITRPIRGRINPWVGIYRERRDQQYRPNSPLRNVWHRVGPRSSKLREFRTHITTQGNGPVGASYVGAVFARPRRGQPYTQIGLSPLTILTSIYTCISCD